MFRSERAQDGDKARGVDLYSSRDIALLAKDDNSADAYHSKGSPPLSRVVTVLSRGGPGLSCIVTGISRVVSGLSRVVPGLFRVEGRPLG